MTVVAAGRPGPSWRTVVTVLLLLGAALLGIVPGVLGLPLAVDHALFHAIFATAVLLPALAIAIRSRQPTIASNAPFVGLIALAAAQLVESIGGLGFGPDNDGRVNALAEVHDLGLSLTPIGLLAALLGVAIGLGVITGRRSGRPVAAMLVAALIVVVGGYGVARLIGIGG